MRPDVDKLLGLIVEEVMDALRADDEERSWVMLDCKQWHGSALPAHTCPTLGDVEVHTRVHWIFATLKVRVYAHSLALSGTLEQ